MAFVTFKLASSDALTHVNALLVRNVEPANFEARGTRLVFDKDHVIVVEGSPDDVISKLNAG